MTPTDFNTTLTPGDPHPLPPARGLVSVRFENNEEDIWRTIGPLRWVQLTYGRLVTADDVTLAEREDGGWYAAEDRDCGNPYPDVVISTLGLTVWPNPGPKESRFEFTVILCEGTPLDPADESVQAREVLPFEAVQYPTGEWYVRDNDTGEPDDSYDDELLRALGFPGEALECLSQEAAEALAEHGNEHTERGRFLRDWGVFQTDGTPGEEFADDEVLAEAKALGAEVQRTASGLPVHIDTIDATGTDRSAYADDVLNEARAAGLSLIYLPDCISRDGNYTNIGHRWYCLTTESAANLKRIYAKE